MLADSLDTLSAPRVAPTTVDETDDERGDDDACSDESFAALLCAPPSPPEPSQVGTDVQASNEGDTATGTSCVSASELQLQDTPLGMRGHTDRLQWIAQHLMRHVQVRQHEGESQLSMRLAGPGSPQLDVELVLRKGMLEASLRVAGRAERELMAQHLPRLERALADRGVRVRRLSITAAGTRAFGEGGKGGHSPHR